jgi:hypothetical protein
MFDAKIYIPRCQYTRGQGETKLETKLGSYNFVHSCFEYLIVLHVIRFVLLTKTEKAY